MSTPTVDKRHTYAEAVNDPRIPVEEISIEKSIQEAENEGLRVPESKPGQQLDEETGLQTLILSPEEVKDKTDAPEVTATEAEIENLKKAQEEQEKLEALAKQKRAELEQYLHDEVGACALLVFDHSNSLNYEVVFGVKPSDNAILAACRDLVLRIESAFSRNLWYGADKLEEDMERIQERITHPGMNRAERRFVKFRGRK